MTAPTREELRTSLQGLTLTRTLDHEGLEDLLASGEFLSCSPGEVLVAEGSKGAELFFVLSGEASVSRRSASGEALELARLHRGDVIGEISLFDERERTATVTAETPLQVFRIERESLFRLGRHVAFLLELLREMALRFRSTSEQYLGTIETQRRQVHEAEKLSTIGSMLSGLLHDLRSPLSVISLAADLLAQSDDSREKQQLLRQIEQHMDLCNHMVENILAFAKGKTTALVRKVYGDEFMEDLRQSLGLFLKGTSVELHLTAAPVKVLYLDERQWKRVLYNLVKNAVEAMEGKGSIYLDLAIEDEDYVFSVRDEGPGIPEAIRDRLFEPFVTFGKPDGTGLGLAMCKRIVEDHGGAISFTTETGRGSTFVLRLPTKPR